jgi:glycosyltransferase involved in cell wall biosynthesis
MSAAIPVITTYHAGIPFIIEHNVTGILVKEHDVKSLTEELITLIQNVETRRNIGLAGQQYALENLDLFKKEIELENIYTEL